MPAGLGSVNPTLYSLAANSTTYASEISRYNDPEQYSTVHREIHGLPNQRRSGLPSGNRV